MLKQEAHSVESANLLPVAKRQAGRDERGGDGKKDVGGDAGKMPSIKQETGTD